MPNQYHWTYEEGSTMLYPEHIQDLLVIDKMWNNKLEKARKDAEAKAKHQANNPLKQHQGNKGSGFYGQTYRYK